MRIVSANGVATHVDVAGEGPDVVFLNSLGTDLRLWDRAVARLPVRAIRYDKRGHGLTETPGGACSIEDLAADAAGVLDAVGAGPAVLVGCSIGGMIAMALAASAPARVRALVLSNTAPRIGTPEMWAERVSAVQAEGLAGLADATMARWFTPATRELPEIAGWRAMLTRTDPQGYAACCGAIGAADLTEAAGRIVCPALVIGGDRDGATPPELVRAAARAIPGARVALIEDAGHLPCAERPDAFAALVREVLPGLAG